MATGLREVLLCMSMGPSILMLMGYEKYYFLFSVARCMKSGLTGFSKLARPTFLGFQIDLFLNRFFVAGNREKGKLELFTTETILSVYETIMFDCSIQHQLIKNTSIRHVSSPDKVLTVFYVRLSIPILHTRHRHMCSFSMRYSRVCSDEG
jgi:hypothetical protein